MRALDDDLPVLELALEYAERIQKEFGVSSVAELEKMMADVDEQLGQKNAEYQAALAEAETQMKKAGIAC